MKIKYEDIVSEARAHGWELVSDEYKNLKTEMKWKCDEGHEIYVPYSHVRNKWECPVCKNNTFKNVEKTVIAKPKGAKRILALDQATHSTGYAIFDDGLLVRADVYQSKGDTEVARISDMRTWLICMVEAWNIDGVGLEDIQLQNGAHRMGVTTYKVLAHLQGVLIECLYSINMPYVVLPSATWRAHCNIKGRTRVDKKRSAQLLVKQWYDITVSDDVSDAICLGKCAVESAHFHTLRKPTYEVTEW